MLLKKMLNFIYYKPRKQPTCKLLTVYLKSVHVCLSSLFNITFTFCLILSSVEISSITEIRVDSVFCSSSNKALI